jgi:8-oxo-dGTP pyrophosphatase MutT (NUDIX family)
MTPIEFRTRLIAATPIGTFTGDYDLNPIGWTLDRDQFRDAAVLIPIMQHAEGLAVLFTQRSEAMTSHAGQISFPGGKVDQADASHQAAALREAWEEVGIPANSVEVIRDLPTYETGSGYRIKPFVGLVTPDFPYAPQQSEVAEVFELPLLDLLARKNHVVESREWKGKEVHYYAINLAGRRIWGATAGMLVSLSRTLGMRK